MRIGIYGGAFDPPHKAHLGLARAAVEQLALNRLYVIPTGQPWMKQRRLTAAEHRLAMARLAFESVPEVQVDDCASCSSAMPRWASRRSTGIW